MAPLNLETHIWCYATLPAVDTHEHLKMSPTGVLEPTVPESDWMLLPKKQIERMQEQLGGEVVPAYLVLGDGYPCFKFTHVLSTEGNRHLFAGSIGSRMNMFVFPKEKVSLVVQVQWSIDNDVLQFHCYRMSGAPIDTYWFQMTCTVFGRDLIVKLRDTMEDELSPAHQIMLVGQDLQPLCKNCALWTPKVKNVKPKAKIMKKTPGHLVNLSNKMKPMH